MTSTSHWLMKAEPESRLEKGVDVKFSIDDLKEMGVSPWDGVRNHEAKNLMKSRMKLGDKVLFYHSNCKSPGVYGTATIEKEGYPDQTAWDEKHPYFDKKSKESNPTWFMVDVKYESHLDHPVTLSLFKTLAATTNLPDCVGYIGEEGLKAVKGMPLVNRGRLSVQSVSEEAYRTVLLLGEKGGWESLEPKKRKSSLKRPPDAQQEEEDNIGEDSTKDEEKAGASSKRKPSTRSGRKRVRISEEDSELSDLPEDRQSKPAPPFRPKVEPSHVESGAEPTSLTNERTRKSSRKR